MPTAKKVKVTGTKAKKKPEIKLTAQQKKAKEARERLEAFLGQGMAKLRADMDLVADTPVESHHDTCKTCRCDEIDNYLFDDAKNYLGYVQNYLEDALHAIDNPDDGLW